MAQHTDSGAAALVSPRPTSALAAAASPGPRASKIGADAGRQTTQGGLQISGAEEGRRLSAASTHAGATPSPEGRKSAQGSTPSPDARKSGIAPLAGGSNGGRPRRGGGRGNDGVEAATLENGRGGGGGGNRREAKVFVGGIPQDMTQEVLHNFFKDWGPVKRAWLQCHRATGRQGQTRPQSHRGFGFVIFSDKSAVDALLGDLPSKYLALKDGRRLEVKHAKSSDEMAKSGEEMGSPPRIGGGGAGASSAHRGGCGGSPATMSTGPDAGDQISGMAGMAPPPPMPVYSMAPQLAMTPAMPGAYPAGQQQAVSQMRPWPPQMSFPTPAMGPQQAMAIPHIVPQTANPMMMAPMQYLGGQGAFPQMAMWPQQQYDPAQYTAPEGLPMIQLGSAVHQAALEQNQQRQQ